MPLALAVCGSLLLQGTLAMAPPATGATSPSSTSPRGRENASLDPRRTKPTYSVGAAARFGILVGSGRDVVQPFGYGFGIIIRAHFLKLAAVRFGLTFQAGHTRFPELRDVEGVDELTGEFVESQRWARLSHTDLSLGPSFSLPLGPVILAGDIGAGLGIDQLFEPDGPFSTLDDRSVVSYDPLLRGGLSVGIPIRRDHGLSVGLDVQKYFSNARYTVREGTDAGDEFSPFDLVLGVSVAYMAWF